jgi:hypothetical protein
MILNWSHLFIILIIYFFQGCLENEIRVNCLQGRYIGSYCEGMVVEIIGESDIAIDWEGMFDSETYSNSIVASLDTVFFSQATDRNELESFILAGNSFYFQYIMGGYPRKQFDVCNPSPFITIFSISEMPCR